MRWEAVGWGVEVAVSFPPSCEAALRARLPFWWWEPAVPVVEPVAAADAAAPPRSWTVEAAAQVPGTVAELELWVAEHAVDAVFVHAGVVARPGAGALVLPGFSMAGKSTLVAALLAAGARFASDEYAVLDLTGHVTRYPRPVSRRDPVRREPVDPACWTPARLPVAAVAHTRFDPGLRGAPPRLADLTPAAATLRLLEHAVAARTRPVECLAAAGAVADRARCVEVVRGEAAAAVPALLALTPTPTPTAW